MVKRFNGKGIIFQCSLLFFRINLISVASRVQAIVFLEQIFIGWPSYFIYVYLVKFQIFVVVFILLETVFLKLTKQDIFIKSFCKDF